MRTTLTLTMAALAAALVDGSLLELQRGGEVWRLVTGHFTHWTHEQLAWDALAFACLGGACERRQSGAYHATLLASILLVPLAVLLFDPRIDAYRGLSGIDSALFALLVVSTRNVFLGVLFAAKIAFETITGGAVFADGGYEVVPVAHVAGAVIGAVAAVLWSGGLQPAELSIARRAKAKGVHLRIAPASAPVIPSRADGEESQNATILDRGEALRGAGRRIFEILRRLRGSG